MARKVMSNSGTIHYGEKNDMGSYTALCSTSTKANRVTNKLDVTCTKCLRKFAKGDITDETPQSDLDAFAYHALVGNYPIYNFDVKKSGVNVKQPLTGEMIGNYEFTDKLQISDYSRTYRGSVHFQLKGSNNEIYAMGPKDMFQMLQMATVVKGEVFGTFTFTRSGGNLKIRMIDGGG